MRSDTNFFARDAQGVKLVVGQNVYSTQHKRTAQLLGVTHPQQICTVRFLDNGEVANVPSNLLKIAAWNDVRTGEKTAVIRAQPDKSGD